MHRRLRVSSICIGALFFSVTPGVAGIFDSFSKENRKIVLEAREYYKVSKLRSAFSSLQKNDLDGQKDVGDARAILNLATSIRDKAMSEDLALSVEIQEFICQILRLYPDMSSGYVLNRKRLAELYYLLGDINKANLILGELVETDMMTLVDEAEILMLAGENSESYSKLEEANSFIKRAYITSGKISNRILRAKILLKFVDLSVQVDESGDLEGLTRMVLEAQGISRLVPFRKDTESDLGDIDFTQKILFHLCRDEALGLETLNHIEVPASLWPDYGYLFFKNLSINDSGDWAEVRRVFESMPYVRNSLIEEFSSFLPPHKASEMISIYAESLWRSGKSDNVSGAFHVALDHAEYLRSKPSDGASKIFFSRLYNRVVGRSLRYAHEVNDHVLAFRAIESSKSRLLNDIMVTDRTGLVEQDARALELTAEMAYLNSKFNEDAYATYRGMTLIGDNASKEFELSSHARRNRVLEEVSALQISKMSQFFLKSASPSITLEDFEKLLEEGETYITSFELNDSLYLLFVDESGERSMAKGKIEDFVPIYRDLISRHCPEGTNIIISPSRSYENYSLETVKIAGQPLILRNPVVRIPSAIIFKSIRSRIYPSRKNGLVVGGLDFRKYANLIYSQNEVDFVMDTFQSKVHLLCDDLDRSSVADAMRSAGFVLFSTHSVSDNYFPLNSRIVINDNLGHDAQLRAIDVIQTDLSPRFVFLNCCESGESRAFLDILNKSSQENFSLSRAFLISGSRNVISSSLLLNDEDAFLMSRAFFQRYYQSWTTEVSIAEIFQKACIDLNNEFGEKKAETIYGSYFLSGDGL